MKNVVFLILCVAGMNAQNIKSSGTHFIDGVKDKNWANSNGKNFTNANFKSYSGSCYVLLETDQTTIVSFRAISKALKGSIEMKLIDESNNQYFNCSTTDECNLQKEITLEKGKKYRLFFTGENANGNYEVTWRTK